MDRPARAAPRHHRGARPSRTIFDLAQNPGPSALQVTVEGKQWWWEFSYPDAKVVTADEMIIPTGRDVYVHLTPATAPAPRRPAT